MAPKHAKRAPARRVLTGVGILLGVIVLAAVCLVGWLMLTEYRPADIETLEVGGEPSRTVRPGDTIKVMTWNIGYGALGDNADFFMDGGSGVYTADEARVRENMTAVIAEIGKNAPDVVFLQETDRDSARSYHIDETRLITDALESYQSVFANNFRVSFLPYPIPPIGKVDSGILTLSALPVTESSRVRLPCPFSWPVRLVNLKRCLTTTVVSLGGDRTLALVNLHLEAYDSGEGKIAQTQMLREVLGELAEKHDHVIAGGDFNQIFSSVENPWPLSEGLWQPGELDVSAFPDGWQFVMDTTAPSCRSLDRPFAGEKRDGFQFYLIDGFIVSEGLEVVSVRTHDLNFANSDHNPVCLTVRLPAD